MIDIEGYPKPYLRSGPNKGKIKDPNVAHEVYNTLEALHEEKKVDEENKVDFFNKYAGSDAGDALILQAAKTIREEEKNKFDDLTKLHQKKSYKLFIEDDIQQLREDQLKSIGIIRLDLDYFSWLNDNVEAHQLGDLYLSIVGKIIRDEVRSKKDIGIRIGGDEFAVLMYDVPDPESFKNAVQRVHTALNRNALFTTLQVILNSNRTTTDEHGSLDREGTVVLKQFLAGLKNLKENKDRRRKHFIQHGRGSMQAKKSFLSVLDDINIERYDQYMSDIKTWSKLDEDDRSARLTQESEITELVDRVFDSLGVSTGGIYLTKNQIRGFHQIDKKTDELVNFVKRRGGRDYRLEVGFTDNKI